MPIAEVTILRRCGRCAFILGELTVKKDNMRLMVNDPVWCDHCGADMPEVREIAGRQSAMEQEQASYPGNPAVEDVSAAEFRRRRTMLGRRSTRSVQQS